MLMAPILIEEIFDEASLQAVLDKLVKENHLELENREHFLSPLFRSQLIGLLEERTRGLFAFCEKGTVLIFAPLEDNSLIKKKIEIKEKNGYLFTCQTYLTKKKGKLHFPVRLTK